MPAVWQKAFQSHQEVTASTRNLQDRQVVRTAQPGVQAFEYESSRQAELVDTP
jgi:hypothetical protein